MLPIFDLARRFAFEVVVKDGVYLIGAYGHAHIRGDGFSDPRQILRIPAEDGELSFERGVVIVRRHLSASPIEERLATALYERRLPRRNRETVKGAFAIPSVAQDMPFRFSLLAALGDYATEAANRLVSFGDGAATVKTPDFHISAVCNQDLGFSVDLGLLMTALQLVFFSGAVVDSGVRFRDDKRGVYVFCAAQPPIAPVVLERGLPVNFADLEWRVARDLAVLNLAALGYGSLVIARAPFEAVVKSSKQALLAVEGDSVLLKTAQCVAKFLIKG